MHTTVVCSWHCQSRITRQGDCPERSRGLPFYCFYLLAWLSQSSICQWGTAAAGVPLGIMQQFPHHCCGMSCKRHCQHCYVSQVSTWPKCKACCKGVRPPCSPKGPCAHALRSLSVTGPPGGTTAWLPPPRVQVGRPRPACPVCSSCHVPTKCHYYIHMLAVCRTCPTASCQCETHTDSRCSVCRHYERLCAWTSATASDGIMTHHESCGTWCVLDVCGCVAVVGQG